MTPHLANYSFVSISSKICNATFLSFSRVLVLRKTHFNVNLANVLQQNLISASCLPAKSEEMRRVGLSFLLGCTSNRMHSSRKQPFVMSQGCSTGIFTWNFKSCVKQKKKTINQSNQPSHSCIDYFTFTLLLSMIYLVR